MCIMAFALYTILLAHLIELLMALFDYSFNIGLSNCDEKKRAINRSQTTRPSDNSTVETARAFGQLGGSDNSTLRQLDKWPRQVDS